MNDTKINKLTKLWYKYVSLDHHKDRDCHWYINKVWSYGDKPYYRVEHYGYIFEYEPQGALRYKTYQKAKCALLALLKRAFRTEIKNAKEKLDNEPEWDAIQIASANWIMNHKEINQLLGA